MARNKKLSLLILAIILITFPLILVLVKQNQDNRSSAAAADKLEAEGGILGGNALNKQDTTASSGKFVELGINPTSSLTPSNTPIPVSSVGLSQCTALDKGIAYIAAPALSMPGYLQSTIDPTFGTKITRVTGDVGTPIPLSGAGNWRTPGGPRYSKIPVWNADQTLLLMANTSAPGYFFLDGTTYQPLLHRGSGPMSAVEARWHPTNPNLLVYVTGSGQVGYWNVRTNSYEQKHPGIGMASCGFGPYEGNVSRDGNKIVVNCGTSFYAVDLSTQTKISPTITASQLGFTSLDWASISPSGNYIVATQNSSINKSLTFTSTSFTEKANLGTLGHYDIGYDTNGNEVATSPRDGMPRLSDGVDTPLVTQLNFPAFHTTTRNLEVPGWAYASTEGGPTSTIKLENEIIAYEIKSSGKVRRIAHHRSTNSVYESETFAAVSPDGKRVFYRSDWGIAGGPVYGFVVDTRNICP